jgi:hypothetical protein
VAMKEFTTAAREADVPADEIMEFVVDGQTCRCFQPSNGQLAILLASISSTQSWTHQVAGVINFFDATLDDDSRAYITRRLLDRQDRFGIDEVQEIIEWMVEEWSSRPTPSPSGSTPSPPKGGRKSTARTPRSTSSGSARADSAASSTAGV